MSRYTRLLEPTGKRHGVRGKAAGLASLISLGLAVPRTAVVSDAARRRYGRCSQRGRLVARLKRELSLLELPAGAGAAVRSSASGEDDARESQAGRYESYLHVRGVDRIFEAIRAVWASRGDDPPARMEVIVQRMVLPAVSGASFSRNPVTGADEVVVEAVEGTSEALLQRGETPRRWVIRGKRAPSNWPPLPDDVLGEIARTTRRVASELRYPADLEWAYDGETLWWLQVRPITSLRGLPVYSNRISREYLPGLVKPLVWSINVPMINGAWIDLFERVVGPLSIDPLSLAKQFHYRAYFNMSGMGELFGKLGLPGDVLEQVFGLVATTGRSPFGFRWRMLRHLPRVARFLVSVSSFHGRLPRWEAAMVRRFESAGQALDGVCELSEAIEWIDAFLPVMREVSRMRIVSLLLHLIAGQLGHRAARRSGVNVASDPSASDPRLDAYDPSAALQHLTEAVAAMPVQELADLESIPIEHLLDRDAWRSVKAQLARFLNRFGHVSESGNDFSAPCWSEHPLAVLRLAAAGRASVATPGPASRPSKGRALRADRRLILRRVDRERVGAVSSQGFHLLRRWAIRCGGDLAESGELDAADDVFLLSLDELRSLADRRLDGDGLRAAVTRRRREMRESEEYSLPETILGDSIPESRAPPTSEESVFSGLGTSRGTFEGRARAIRSMETFGEFRDGDVLVVPFSDIAWAPLFARAGAIVAEAGGLLSHSSIVAREGGIPAVVSVPNACALLDGKRVRVNGLLGTVKVLP